jgi:hypothetical protein
MAQHEAFEIIYKEQSLPVERMMLGNFTCFRVGLIGKAALVVTRAQKGGGEKFWTSVPEGRQVEAEQIGPLIEAYYRRQQ